MSDDDAKVLVDRLDCLAEFVGTYSQANPKYIREAISLIKRQAAENAALRAEVERLTAENARCQSVIDRQDKSMWEKDGQILKMTAEVERLTLASLPAPQFKVGDKVWRPENGRPEIIVEMEFRELKAMGVYGWYIDTSADGFSRGGYEGNYSLCRDREKGDPAYG
jgi:hypothetical protein